MLTIFAGLTSTPAPTAILVGILSVLLFAIVGIVIGPGFEGINAPTIGKIEQETITKETSKSDEKTKPSNEENAENNSLE